MNFNLINYRNSFPILIVFLLLLAFLGCATPWQNKSVVTYQTIGETLNTVKPVMQNLCASSDISAEDCESIKKAYNEGVSIYKTLGDAAIVALDTGDSGRYKDLKSQLLALLEVLNNFILAHQ